MGNSCLAMSRAAYLKQGGNFCNCKEKDQSSGCQKTGISWYLRCPSFGLSLHGRGTVAVYAGYLHDCEDI